MASISGRLSKGEAGVSRRCGNRGRRERMASGGKADPVSVGAHIFQRMVDFAEKRPVCAFFVITPLLAVIIAQMIYAFSGAETPPRMYLGALWRMIGELVT